MQSLFETNINQVVNVLSRTTDAEIILTSASFIVYEQLKLDDNYRTYLEGVLISEHVFRTGIKPTSYKKSCNLIPGTESKVTDFQVVKKQFSFLSISFVFDSSDQHRSVYDSYNVELAGTKIMTVQAENVSNTYSSFNAAKFDTSEEQDKY